MHEKFHPRLPQNRDHGLRFDRGFFCDALFRFLDMVDDYIFPIPGVGDWASFFAFLSPVSMYP